MYGKGNEEYQTKLNAKTTFSCAETVSKCKTIGCTGISMFIIIIFIILYIIIYYYYLLFIIIYYY
jgi:hypothetical protein